MKRIGVLGGSFNPIHKGHVALGLESIKAFSLDALIVVPSGTHPFKGDTEVSADDRFNMTVLAFANEPKVMVSDMETKSKEINYSFNTLAKLKEQYPDAQLVFINGADIIYELHKWYRANELGKYCSFGVSTRGGYERPDLQERIDWLKQELGILVEFANMDLPEVSSTEVRNRLSQGLDCDDLVPVEVLAYINERGLYR